MRGGWAAREGQSSKGEGATAQEDCGIWLTRVECTRFRSFAGRRIAPYATSFRPPSAQNSWTLLGDIPTYLSGLWEKAVAKCDSRCPALW